MKPSQRKEKSKLTIRLKSENKTKISPPELTIASSSNFQGQENSKDKNFWNLSTAFISNQGRTAANNSKFSLLNRKEDIQQGDLVELQITAIDEYNRPRPYGGDLWQATMYNSSNKFGTMGKVIDHGNGTYSALFYAGYVGQVTMEVMLIVQRETIHWLQNDYRPSELRAAWKGKFVKGNTVETSHCFVQREGTWENKCEFPHPGALGKTKFLCDVPATLPCSSLINIRVDNVQSINVILQIKAGVRDHEVLFHPPNAMVAISGDVSTLRIRDRKYPSPELVPDCKVDLPPTISDGYWSGNRWHSLVCKNKPWFDKTEVQRCLKGKDIYFLGDSTTRQWFQKMLEIIGYPVNVTHNNWRQRVTPIPNKYMVTGNDDYKWQIRDLKNDINMIYRHHALTRHSEIPIDRFPFMVDVIDNLPSPKCKYILVISLWAHFDTWTRESYVDRLMNIQQAIRRLRLRCPETLVAVKGPHERGNVFTYWLLLDMVQTMKDVFIGHKVFFIDIWDMNFAYSVVHGHKMDIHMPMELIREEICMFLSYICKQNNLL
ncbi:NXPE family member 4-like [Glandiceps talaboti]